MTAGRPLVVLVVGIPGAGKTTVAAALAARFPRSACIEGDLVQHRFTVNGLVVLAPRAEVAAARDRARADKQVAHLFPGADAELRAALDGVGWWLDTSDLDVGQSVDAIVTEGLAAGRMR